MIFALSVLLESIVISPASGIPLGLTSGLCSYHPLACEAAIGGTLPSSLGPLAYWRERSGWGRLAQGSTLLFCVCRLSDCCGSGSQCPWSLRRELCCCVSVRATGVALVTLLTEKTVLRFPLKKKGPSPSLKWNPIFIRRKNEIKNNFLSRTQLILTDFVQVISTHRVTVILFVLVCVNTETFMLTTDFGTTKF